jgi:hypothetical protein
MEYEQLCHPEATVLPHYAYPRERADTGRPCVTTLNQRKEDKHGL